VFDFRRAFTYVFDDADWPAILVVGGILSVIPGLSLLIQVYFYPTLGNVATGQPDTPLAGWPGFWTLIGRAIRSIVVGFVVVLIAIPFLILGVVLALGYIFHVVDTNATATLRGFLDYYLTPARFPLLALMLILVLVTAMIGNACVARFAVTDSIGESLPFGAVRRLLFAEPVAWLIAVAVGLLLTAVPVQLVGLLEIEGMAGRVLGWAATAVAGIYGVLVQFHLFGQAYRRSAQTLWHEYAARTDGRVSPQAF
jgi:hypothetical protein